MKRTTMLDGIKRLAEPLAAPFDEHDTRNALHAWVESLSLPYTTDVFGNTIVRVRRGMPRRKIAFVAHLDHPGLRAESIKGAAVTCRPEGMLPAVGICDTRVVFPRTRHGVIKGKIERAKVAKQDGAQRVQEVVVGVPAKGPKPEPGDFAVFDLPALGRKNNRLKMRAADDLIGVAAIVAALSDLGSHESPIEAWGIFTRAEEVGFHGAVAMAMESKLPRDLTLVSIECSRAIAPIELGKGPVVRLGDRTGPFDPKACALLQGAAKTLTEGRPKVPLQSGMMTGGSCEATAFLSFGYQAAGIAIPLHAYHNQGAKSVVPEEVDLNDVEGAVQLIVASAVRAGAGTDDLDLLRNELIRKSEQGRERLRAPTDPKTGYPVGWSF